MKGRVLLLLVAACSAGNAPPNPVPVIDWSNLQATTVEGFGLRHCEGDAPLLCVDEGDRTVGVVELVQYPVTSFDILRGIKDPQEAVALVAKDYLGTFEADRAAGCPDHDFSAIEPVEATVAGNQGLRYGFSLSLGERETDRSLQHAVVIGGLLSIFGVEALGDGSCLSNEGAAFAPEALDRFLPVFEKVVAQSRLP